MPTENANLVPMRIQTYPTGNMESKNQSDNNGAAAAVPPMYCRQQFQTMFRYLERKRAQADDEVENKADDQADDQHVLGAFFTNRKLHIAHYKKGSDEGDCHHAPGPGYGYAGP